MRRMVILGEQPPEVVALIEKRRRLGQDKFDEVWAGDYHIVPCPPGLHGRVHALLQLVLGPIADALGLYPTGRFNLGRADDYRCPDGGVHREIPEALYFETAAIVIEVLAPEDETLEKFDFYAAHGVEELCLADPWARTLQWFARTDDGYVAVDHSDLLDVSLGEVAARIEWPA
ncbi:MAG: Uma2 family endonuclease [Sporichthyaceae bacterium]